jgi:energy-coupling factor transport system substrate-specific component
MSWQLACLALLAAVLFAGTVWYERSRPSAKLVALVAALAALAVAGRLVLAPVPNVVATTDIVLIAGYSLGGAPGFTVGALAALVSNFWLGQGPWTPWQMAGWGLTGIGGAILAATAGRRLGRLALALACAAAGLAYGALLDLSVMVTYGGEQSLERYLALSARGIPFNLAHAGGNFVFALLAGPALARMLLRFRARLEIAWRESAPGRGKSRRGRAATATAAIVAVSILSVAGAARADAAAGDVAQAERWLERVQNRDGGFGASPGSSSSVGITTWAVLGLEAAGSHPHIVRRDRRSALDYLRAHAGEIRSTTDLERAILAIEGAGLGARRFAGRDLVSELASRRRGDASFRGQVNITAFGILALRAGGRSASALGRSARWLRRAQNGDGGWGFAPGAASDADSTGAALQALAAGGAASGSAARDGVRYLHRGQRGDGGWPLASGGPTNSQSTAWAIQGLLAVGADPGSRAFDYLAARQAGDGHYRYSSASDQTPVWVTAQAMLAARKSPFPLEPVERAPDRDRLTAGGGSGGSGSGRQAARASGPVASSAPGAPKRDAPRASDGHRRQGRWGERTPEHDAGRP